MIIKKIKKLINGVSSGPPIQELYLTVLIVPLEAS